jgi:hypothetical protein
LVRNRPATKPPSAADNHWTTISPIPALIVNVVAEVPAFGHADTVVRPRPAPSDVRTTPTAIAATAPATTAAQLTADAGDSLLETEDALLETEERSPSVDDTRAMINAKSRRE